MEDWEAWKLPKRFSIEWFKQTEVLRIIIEAITLKRCLEFYSRVGQLWEIYKFQNDHDQIQKSFWDLYSEWFSTLAALVYYEKKNREMTEKKKKYI